ncbi:MAG: DUF935 family protein [Akkermansia sp.]
MNRQITSNSAIASASHRVGSKTALNTLPPSMTYAEIQTAYKARSGAEPKKASGLMDIVLPQARGNWLMPSLACVTPAWIERVLTGALMGNSPEEEHALYNLMCQTWPRLVKNMQELKNAVNAKIWNVQTPEHAINAEVAKSLAERARDGMKGDYHVDGAGWRGTISGLLDGWFTGVVVREIDWEVRGCSHLPQAVLPRQTRRVSASWYGWSAESGRFGIRLPSNPGELVDVPLNKFLVGINNVSLDHPSGGALLRSLAWFWCASNFSSEWLLNFAQLFGQPFRWATYDPATPALKNTLAQMLSAMGSAAWAAVPAGTTIEYKEASKGSSDSPQMQMITLADTACDLLILGQTLTSDVGKNGSGSRALGEVHFNVRGDIVDAAAGWCAEILNEQYLPAVYALNFGDTTEDAGLPYFEPSAKVNHDPKAAAEIVEILLRAGIPLVKNFAHEFTGTPQPQEDDEVYTAPSPQQGISGNILAKMPVQAREYYLAKAKELGDE